MTVSFSFTRMGSFEPCTFQDKYSYLDGADTEKETIEAFKGSRVHLRDKK
jgi:hypothetical protein